MFKEQGFAQLVENAAFSSRGSGFDPTCKLKSFFPLLTFPRRFI